MFFVISGGGGDVAGTEATTGGVATLEGGAVTVEGFGGGETGLVADGATSAVVATGTAITISGARRGHRRERGQRRLDNSGRRDSFRAGRQR